MGAADARPPLSPADARVPLTPALARLSVLIDGLDTERRRAARTYAAQLELFAGLIPVVQARREERIATQPNPRRQKVWLADREVLADAAATLHLSENMINARMTRARLAVTVFPAVHTALQAGVIDPGHADVICDTGTTLDTPNIDDTVRAEFAAVGVAVAQEETPARLRGILTSLVSKLVPETVEEQVVEAAQRRRVSVYDLEPGLARLVADLPTALAYGIHDRLTKQAELLKTTNDEALQEALTAAAAAAVSDAGAATAASTAASMAAASGAATADAAAVAAGDAADSRAGAPAARPAPRTRQTPRIPRWYAPPPVFPAPASAPPQPAPARRRQPMPTPAPARTRPALARAR